MGGRTDQSLALRAFNGLFIEWLSLPDTNEMIGKTIKIIKGVSEQPGLMSPNNRKKTGNYADRAPPPLMVSDNFETPIRTSNRSPRSPKHATLTSPVRTSQIGVGSQSPTPPRSPVSRARDFMSAQTLPPGSPMAFASPISKRKSKAKSPIPVIKPFFFPNGIPASPTTKNRAMAVIDRVFLGKDEGLTKEDFFTITSDAFEVSSYLNTALFERVLRENGLKPPFDTENGPPRIKRDEFLKIWKKEFENPDQNKRIFNILRRDGNQYLRREDFESTVQEIVDRHPGLEFLEATPEFQVRYAQTVIARIFYAVNIAANEKLTLRELKRSNLMEMLQMLDDEDDINKINDFFSYEHFYVIYCKFWELDTDHDSLLDSSDLLRYDDYSLTSAIVDRIFAQIPRKFLSDQPGKMGYLDFVAFLIAEVDKTSEVSLNYWFKCLDLDRDGVVAQYEIEHFFKEQQGRMQALSQEDVLLVDVMCQLLDAMKPKDGISVTKKDIKKSQLAALFFNTLFNCNAMITMEQRDPGRIKQQHATPQLSEWDRYAIAGYYRLAEPEDDEWEGDEGEYDDEYEDDFAEELIEGDDD